ncbi:hypothetical protein GCM10017711_40500 [Paeniglutamicibacter sulfureus]
MRLVVYYVLKFSVHEVMRLHTRSPGQHYHQMLFSTKQVAVPGLSGKTTKVVVMAEPGRSACLVAAGSENGNRKVDRYTTA